MILRSLIAFFISVSACSAAEKWSLGTIPTETSRGYIAVSQEGFSSLSEAIAQFPTQAPSAQLIHIWLARFLDKDAISQEEIKAYLEKHYSKELSAAMRSSGNMHNPKVTPLRKGFEEAVLSTTFVKKANADLAKMGYKISSVSTEKFHIIKPANTFSAATWLVTTK